MKINKEYIERRALLNEIEEIRPLNWTDTEAEITEQLDYDTFENLVKSQFPADVQEVRRGEWERALNQKHSAKWSTRVACSICHKQGFNRYNFCPHCGAKMDKE